MYFIIRLFHKILNVLPLNWVFVLGKIIGTGFYYFSKSKRKVGFVNLKLVFPYKSNREIFYILRRSFINFGMSVVESFVIGRIIRQNWFDFSAFSDVNLQDNNILVGIHAGSWELCNAIFAKKINLAIFAQRQKNLQFDRFINEQREKYNTKVCFSLRSLARYLNNGYWAGLVVDHGAERNALYIEFFGNSVPTPRGAVYLARKFNKKIYPVFVHRKKGNIHVFMRGDVIDCHNISDKEALRRLNKTYEKFLSIYPQEYIWWYKRFKRRSEIHTLILSDGKAGHLKQSLIFCSLMEEKGYKIVKQVIEIGKISRVKRFIIELCSFFSHRDSLGRLWPLRWLIDKSLFYKLSRTFADFVVSTGSSMAGINLIVAHSLGAKSVVLLKPNLPIERFDLAVVPDHDNLTAPNVVNIKGALSYPPDAYNDGVSLSRQFKLSDKNKIAIFVGGPLADEKLFYSNIRLFLSRIKDFCARRNLNILITTSRRTPKRVERLIEKVLKGFKNTEIIIIANRKNYSFITGGFLNYASVVFVSTDSISMISESLSMKKATVGVELEEILNHRHINFIASVENLISLLRPPYDRMEDFCEPAYSLFDYNRSVIKDAVGRFL